MKEHAMVQASARKPGILLLIIGGIVLALGLMASALSLSVYIGWVMGGVTDDLQQIKAPGKAIIKVEEPGRILIYHEWKSSAGRQRYTGFNPEMLMFALRDSNGQEVEVSPSSSTESYKIGDLNGTGKWEFAAPAAGEYTLVTGLPPEMQAEFDLTVGPSRFKGDLESMLLFLGLLIGAGIVDILGVVLIVMGVVARLRSNAVQEVPAS